ncbi:MULTISPECIES: hypothetical protein [Myroides]|uniref:Uncharacterized protein n=1 Tax=Myroides albus TaxID=2562892 RepID=A0A6I3LKI9_9FLAO|nr:MULTISPECIES: hypothetical protein [Myroides]MTG98833.1 hypothetical protein [Myroides albus]MVX36667.1 hypothetical protein [Myroides sp. LoEW2-1]UVD80470.1 hypothetical protein NWE55_04150 [Myroides albus]
MTNRVFLFVCVVFCSLIATSCKSDTINTDDIMLMYERALSVDDKLSNSLLEQITQESELEYTESSISVVKPVVKVFNCINAIKDWSEVSTKEFATKVVVGLTTLYYNDKHEIQKIVVRKIDKEMLDAYYFDKNRIALVVSQQLVFHVDRNSDEFNVDQCMYVKEVNYFIEGELAVITSNIESSFSLAEYYIKEVDKKIKDKIKKLKS